MVCGVKKFLMIGFVAALLVACGDDDRNSATRLTRNSSSSEIVFLSSSEGANSSSEQFSSSVAYVAPSTVVTGTMTDKRDGRTYKTVKIGEQWWMAENLNFHSTKSWCYGNDGANCNKYGRLYLWGAAMDGAGMWTTNGKGCDLFKKVCSPTYPVRGICPEGWHLPDSTEWKTLFAALGENRLRVKCLSPLAAGSRMESALMPIPLLHYRPATGTTVIRGSTVRATMLVSGVLRSTIAATRTM